MPNLEKKQAAVDVLTEQIGRAQLTVLADYRGLTVSDMASLRGRLRDAHGEFRVAKNTMTRRAAERLGCDELVPYLVGPTGLALGYGDPAALAKAVSDFARTSRILTVKGALLGSRVLLAEDVSRLGDLPPRDVLLARVVGGMQAPIAGLVTVLNGSLRGLLTVLDGRRQQLAEGGSPS